MAIRPHMPSPRNQDNLKARQSRTGRRPPVSSRAVRNGPLSTANAHDAHGRRHTSRRPTHTYAHRHRHRHRHTYMHISIIIQPQVGYQYQYIHLHSQSEQPATRCLSLSTPQASSLNVLTSTCTHTHTHTPTPAPAPAPTDSPRLGLGHGLGHGRGHGHAFGSSSDVLLQVPRDDRLIERDLAPLARDWARDWAWNFGVRRNAPASPAVAQDVFELQQAARKRTRNTQVS